MSFDTSILDTSMDSLNLPISQPSNDSLGDFIQDVNMENPLEKLMSLNPLPLTPFNNDEDEFDNYYSNYIQKMKGSDQNHYLSLLSDPNAPTEEDLANTISGALDLINNPHHNNFINRIPDQMGNYDFQQTSVSISEGNPCPNIERELTGNMLPFPFGDANFQDHSFSLPLDLSVVDEITQKQNEINNEFHYNMNEIPKVELIDPYMFWKRKHRAMVIKECPDMSEEKIEEQLQEIWKKVPGKYREKYIKMSLDKMLAATKKVQQRIAKQQKAYNDAMLKAASKSKRKSSKLKGNSINNTSKKANALDNNEDNVYHTNSLADGRENGYIYAMKETMTYNSPDKSIKRRLSHKKNKKEDLLYIDNLMSTGFIQDVMLNDGIVDANKNDLSTIVDALDFTDLDSYLSGGVSSKNENNPRSVAFTLNQEEKERIEERKRKNRIRCEKVREKKRKERERNQLAAIEASFRANTQNSTCTEPNEVTGDKINVEDPSMVDSTTITKGRPKDEISTNTEISKDFRSQEGKKGKVHEYFDKTETKETNGKKVFSSESVSETVHDRIKQRKRKSASLGGEDENKTKDAVPKNDADLSNNGEKGFENTNQTNQAKKGKGRLIACEEGKTKLNKQKQLKTSIQKEQDKNKTKIAVPRNDIVTGNKKENRFKNQNQKDNQTKRDKVGDIVCGDSKAKLKKQRKRKSDKTEASVPGNDLETGNIKENRFHKNYQQHNQTKIDKESDIVCRESEPKLKKQRKRNSASPRGEDENKTKAAVPDNDIDMKDNRFKSQSWMKNKKKREKENDNTSGESKIKLDKQRKRNSASPRGEGENKTKAEVSDNDVDTKDSRFESQRKLKDNETREKENDITCEESKTKLNKERKRNSASPRREDEIKTKATVSDNDIDTKDNGLESQIQIEMKNENKIGKESDITCEESKTKLNKQRKQKRIILGGEGENKTDTAITVNDIGISKKTGNGFDNEIQKNNETKRKKEGLKESPIKKKTGKRKVSTDDKSKKDGEKKQTKIEESFGNARTDLIKIKKPEFVEQQICESIVSGIPASSMERRILEAEYVDEDMYNLIIFSDDIDIETSDGLLLKETSISRNKENSTTKTKKNEENKIPKTNGIVQNDTNENEEQMDKIELLKTSGSCIDTSTVLELKEKKSGVVKTIKDKSKTTTAKKPPVKKTGIKPKSRCRK